MAAYLAVLIIQTAAATFLFVMIFPVFRQMIVKLGEPQEISLLTDAEIALSALTLHGAYWVRYMWIAIIPPMHSPFVGHLVQFGSRTSFFFGGALFSVVFFRHVPALAALPTIDQTLLKGFLLFWVLFALFCYSLELDRLGKAIEEPPKQS
ncbi:MAG: hypothetical protein EOO23_03395 [Comamonadaceae bacterium]|nr:MAG: hypothetical protein EOO23_03395 [Comamonadaceae bacterium]